MPKHRLLDRGPQFLSADGCDAYRHRQGAKRAPACPRLTPWSLGQGKVWLWISGAWARAPDLALPAGTILPGTLCAERGYHELEVVEEYLACRACGFVAESPTE